eukprot:m.187359 g.187359  ORF g.187359 m.187359 type:complete len:643 (-) comp18155_c0_seq12:3920-5848(-)
MAEYTGRPATGSRRPGTGMRLGTASMRSGYGRIGTAKGGGRTTAAGARLGTTSRPGTSGGALNAQVRVPDRIMTQQGLAGMRTAPKTAGQGRFVQDESFFLGALRTKNSELRAEIATIRKELQSFEREQAGFSSYEQRAESLAKEIKDLQGELGDLNVLQDMLSTHTEIEGVVAEKDELKTKNDREARDIDDLFSSRRSAEQQIAGVEKEIEAQLNVESTLVADMDSQQRQAYDKLRSTNAELTAKIGEQQASVDQLNTKVSSMEDELRANPIKQEAVALYDEIHGLEQKRESIQAELELAAQESPEQQRERLMQQVKRDNQEIAGMDRKITELQGELSRVQDEITDFDEYEDDGGSDEKKQKYLELLKKEAEMQEFLDQYEESQQTELERIARTERGIVALLESSSRTIHRTTALPSQNEHRDMKADLAFKKHEMDKSKSTAENLEGERARLKKDLANVNQLEGKVTKDMAALKEKIAKMETELPKLRDLDGLAAELEQNKRKLAKDKERLGVRKDTMKAVMLDLAGQYERLKTELAENETHTQLVNLEKKWQHHEKNNFVMKEFIAAKELEGNFVPLAENAMSLVHVSLQPLLAKTATHCLLPPLFQQPGRPLTFNHIQSHPRPCNVSVFLLLFFFCLFS